MHVRLAHVRGKSAAICKQLQWKPKTRTCCPKQIHFASHKNLGRRLTKHPIDSRAAFRAARQCCEPLIPALIGLISWLARRGREGRGEEPRKKIFKERMETALILEKKIRFAKLEQKKKHRLEGLFAIFKANVPCCRVSPPTPFHV